MADISHHDQDYLLPPLKEIPKCYHLTANKSLGQNFLLDINLLRKIAKSSKVLDTDCLEIGAGPGGLTRALLAEGAKKVIVIEKDLRCIPILNQIKDVYQDRIEIIHGDALKIDFDGFFSDNYRISTNLPYNISSEFITGLLTQKTYPKKWLSATMMLQKEFAIRMQAHENSKDYGRLSVLSHLTCQSKILFDVNPANFTPPPKVMSSIVHIIPHQEQPACDIDILEKVTRASFGQRRKMLRSSLKQVTTDTELLCEKANIDSTLRADHLTPQDYVRLCHALL